jgi:uncharacterized repeat protein (TIGR01451 family)
MPGFWKKEACVIKNRRPLLRTVRDTVAAIGVAALALTAPLALADTAGGTMIHNVATLTYSGGSVRAVANVTVNTVASTPTLTVDQVAQSGVSGDTVSYTYTLTHNANGSDTFNLSETVVDTGISAPVVSYRDSNGNLIADSDGDAGARPDLSLGGSVTSQPSGNGVVTIPAGSETHLQAGDTVVIGGNLYAIASLLVGTQASTDIATGVTTAETPTALTLTPLGGAPAITAGSVPAGTQLGEQLTFTVEVNTGVPTGATGTHDLDLTLQTVATNAAGTTLSYTTSVADGNHTTTTVTPRLDPTIVKDVCNLSLTPLCVNGDYQVSGLYAKSGETLQYRITMSAAAANAATGSVLTDEPSSYTSYVANSTTLNGNAVADDGGADPFPLSTTNLGLAVNSAGAAAGEIAAGAQAVVLYRVTVQ